MSISAIVLTKNEEDMLASCLKTLKFCDEIIIIDNGSTDETVSIAKKYTDKIYQGSFGGFDQKRNFGLEKASGDWVLYVDADERVSKKLTEKIKETINSDLFDAYKIRRLNVHFGKVFKHGGFGDEYVTRLFRKGSLKGWFGKIHESPNIEGRIGQIEELLVHLTHRNIMQMILKTASWAKMEAKLLHLSNHPKVTWWRIIKITEGEFFSRYFKKFGFLDGLEGFLEAAFQAINKFVVYVNLWEMQKKLSLEKIYKDWEEKVDEI